MKKQRQISPVYTGPIKKKRQYRARITLDDVREMAQLASMRISETESCAVLKIPVRSWRDYRARHKNDEVFQELLSEMRGQRIAAHIKNVEKFSKKDWRASIAALEKLENGRFGSRAVSISETNNINLTLEFKLQQEAARLVYGDDPKPAPKPLPEPKNEVIDVDAPKPLRNLNQWNHDSGELK